VGPREFLKFWGRGKYIGHAGIQTPDRPLGRTVTLKPRMTSVVKMDSHVLVGMNWNENQKQFPRIPEGYFEDFPIVTSLNMYRVGKG
jgi:hypothetical protein